MLDTAKSVLGQTTGKGAYNEKEACWWWNEEVQKAVKEKKLKFKQYQQSRCDEDKEEFREANKRAKREVAKAKESAYRDLYDKLDSIELEGQKMVYKLSKTREKRTRDLTDIAYIKARWKESFETLLNVEHEREEIEPTDPVQGLIPSVNDIEIRKQLSVKDGTKQGMWRPGMSTTEPVLALRQLNQRNVQRRTNSYTWSLWT